MCHGVRTAELQKYSVYKKRRYFVEQENGPRKRLKAGRRPIISELSLNAAREIAEVHNLSKDSARSPQCVIDSIELCRRRGQDDNG